MAIMIPVVPRDYDELSLEGEMFSALSLLPDDRIRLPGLPSFDGLLLV